MLVKPRILIVDDEPDIGEFISDVAIDVGFNAVAIHDTYKFEKIISTGFDLVVLDLVMPGRDGVELLRFMVEESQLPDETRKYLRNVERYRGQYETLLGSTQE